MKNNQIGDLKLDLIYEVAHENEPRLCLVVTVYDDR